MFTRSAEVRGASVGFGVGFSSPVGKVKLACTKNKQTTAKSKKILYFILNSSEMNVDNYTSVSFFTDVFVKMLLLLYCSHQKSFHTVFNSLNFILKFNS